MKRKMISGKDLVKMGYPQGRAIGNAINAVYQHFRDSGAEEIHALLKAVLADPKAYVDDPIWAPTALALLPRKKKGHVHELLPGKVDFPIYGAAQIDEGALGQMQIAMKLPVTVSGALMPDAHPGYGLPIGGVLATENAVIPYGVGVDIGCRMCLSAYPMGEDFLKENRSSLKKMLLENTRFGRQTFKRPMEHEVLDRREFNEVAILRELKDKAASQIGTSGSGNHFVEFGTLALGEGNIWNLPPGNYLAVLSHSGSRGLGAEIARHYTRVAKEQCLLPSEAQNLAWLDLSTEAGQEYWIAMSLAGDYASANHHQIHERMAKSLGEQPLLMVENHHNFAWKEKLPDGKEVIVHRKGATPAGKDVLGVIPGSLTAPGFIVRGKGNPTSLASAAHGAGRVMSRTAAKSTINRKMLKQELDKHGVELIGGGLDEAPMVYKDIRDVMRYQDELVETLGVFTPRIVRMCGDETPPED
ncbi:MAG: RtcB family protein [Bacteroidota bacterium]|nr:MAG: RNA-splicing ligase RtcB [Bacteroidota bacterium]